jgi:hypothetical protein
MIFQILGLAFSHFLVQSHNLRVLRLHYLNLDTCHCRAMDALARTDLQIVLIECVPTESGRQNRGPSQLIYCRIDTRGLADALRGNSTVNSLTLRATCRVASVSDEDRLVLFQTLAENEGLVTLDLHTAPITDESWIALWRSVARHPKLETIVLPIRNSRVATFLDQTTEAKKYSQNASHGGCASHQRRAAHSGSELP